MISAKEAKSQTELSRASEYEVEKLGYKVYQGSQYNESYCSISW